MSRIKILFVTPFAGRTGSEMVLLNFLNHIDQTKFEVRLFSLQNGELLNEIPKSILTYFDNSNSSLLKRIIKRIKDKLQFTSSLEAELLRVNKDFKPEIWFLNTMIMANVVDIAIKNKVKYAVHFHELLSQYNFISDTCLQKTIEHSAFTVGCCQTVCENLKVLGSKNVLKQYECIDINSILVDKERQKEIKTKYNIPENFQVIVMSGQRIDRKGYDLFIDVAQSLRYEKYFFIWLGAQKHSGYEFFINKYITHNHLENLLIIHPPQADYYNFLDLADVFFLSSREDPFPLVMLEANFLGKYIVSLNSGGASEFIDWTKGHIIKSWNIIDIVAELKLCCNNIKENKVPIVRVSDEFDAIKQTKKFEFLLENFLLK